MFRRLEDSAPERIEIEIDGEPVLVPAGISLAAALFYLDAMPNRRTQLSASPRAAFCMMGACFECLLEVEGEGSQRACQLQVRPGLRAWRQLDPLEPGANS